MSAPANPPSGAVPTELKPKSKTLLYVLLGCGGCLALAGVAGVGLVVLAGFATRGAVSAGQNMSSSMKVVTQQASLSIFLMGDEPRSAQLKKTWDELQKEAQSGELKAGPIDELQKEIDDATADEKLTAEEADAILAHGDKLVR